MASGIPPWYFSSHSPIDFGYIGWTSDPLCWGASAQNGTGVLVLTRMRAAATGTIQAIDYYNTVAGSGLTASQNLIGVYDTGQATSGLATLLGTSVDQTTNGAATGELSAAMASGAPVNAGNDYFVGFLWVGSTIPTVAASGKSLSQNSLSGLNFRAARYGSGLTSLPSSIPAGSLAYVNTCIGAVCR